MARDTVPLDGLDLNLLVTLRALLRENSVTRAAERLGQTQPTVSRSLATLRAAFGDPLFVRSGRGLAPTPTALSLRTPLERSLAAIDRLRSAGAFNAAKARRTFRITLPDVIGVLVVPTLTRLLSDRAPRTSLQILGSEGDALRTLLEDEVDLVVGAPVLDHPELYARTVSGGLGWSVLCGPQHPDAETMTFEAWLRSPHVQLTPAGRPDTPSMLDRLLAEHHHRRRIALRVGYLSALPDTLRETSHVVSLPTPTAEWLARGTRLRVVPHPFEPLPHLTLRMTWHEAHHADAGHRWLREQMVEALELP